MSAFKPMLESTRTNDARIWVTKIERDLDDLKQQAQAWVRATASEQLDRQLAIRKRAYVATVDGSQHKPIATADRKVVITFPMSVLARVAARAPSILRNYISQWTTRRSGKLLDSWRWYLKRDGTVRSLGAVLSPTFPLYAGDVLMLASDAPYAQAVNRLVMRARTQRASERRRRKPTTRKQRKASGFMAAAMRELRRDLKSSGLIGRASFTFVEPPAPSGIARYRRYKQGSPILVFVVRPFAQWAH